MFVVVMRPPLAADVMTMEVTVTRFVGDWFAAPPPALLVVEVDVDVDAEADVVVVDDGVGVVALDDDDFEVVALEVVSLEVVPPSTGLTTILGEAAAGPVVLMKATDVPSASGKKSLELVLSQQTFDELRLWSQHHSPP